MADRPIIPQDTQDVEAHALRRGPVEEVSDAEAHMFRHARGADQAAEEAPTGKPTGVEEQDDDVEAHGKKWNSPSEDPEARR